MVIAIRVVYCNFNVVTNKNHRKRSQLTHTTRSPVPTWQFALVVAFQKVASLSKDATLSLRFFFSGGAFFVILFSENRLQRGSGRWEVRSGGAASRLTTFGWRCFFPVLVDGAGAAVLPLHLMCNWTNECYETKQVKFKSKVKLLLSPLLVRLLLSPLFLGAAFLPPPPLGCAACPSSSFWVVLPVTPLNLMWN